MSSFEHPISLSDEQLNVITPLAEPLAPPDRSAFLRWRTCCATSRSRSATAWCSDRRGSFCRLGTTSSTRQSRPASRLRAITGDRNCARPRRSRAREASERLAHGWRASRARALSSVADLAVVFTIGQ